MWTKTHIMVLITFNHPKALYGQQHIKSSSYAACNNKGTDKTALPSTQPGQHICHSFSIILYFIHTIKFSIFGLVTCSHYKTHIFFPGINTQIRIPEL